MIADPLLKRRLEFWASLLPLAKLLLLLSILLSACSVFDQEADCVAAQKGKKTMLCCPVANQQWRCAWLHKIEEG